MKPAIRARRLQGAVVRVLPPMFARRPRHGVVVRVLPERAQSRLAKLPRVRTLPTSWTVRIRHSSRLQWAFSLSLLLPRIVAPRHAPLVAHVAVAVVQAAVAVPVAESKGQSL